MPTAQATKDPDLHNPMIRNTTKTPQMKTKVLAYRLVVEHL